MVSRGREARGGHALLAAMRDLGDRDPAAEPPARRPLLERWLRLFSGSDRLRPDIVDRLSDHMLRDIGLRRAQARDVLSARRRPRP